MTKEIRLEDEVRVDGLEVNLDPNVKYYALHKPPGVVTTMHDPQGRPDIRAYLPPDGPRVFPVGRLDRESEGLLLLMNDGDLANGLTHPRFGVEKEYLAEVEGVPTPKHVGRLRRGVELDDGPARATEARVAGRIGGSRGRPPRDDGRPEARGSSPARSRRATGVSPRSGTDRTGAVGFARPGERRELTLDEVIALRRAVDG